MAEYIKQTRWEKMTPDRLLAIKAQAEANLRSVAPQIHAKVTGPEAFVKYHERQVALSSATLAGWKNDSTISEEKILLERRRLAEALIVTGEIDKAIEVAPTAEIRGRAEALKTAVYLDDNAHCDCKPSEHRGHNFSSKHGTLFHIKSPKHGKVMPVRKCSVCGHLNVTPVDPHPRLTPEDERRLGHATDADRAKYAAMAAQGLKARVVK